MRIIKDPSLVLELQFDEGIGSRAVDQSKYDNHGDIKGAAWTKGVIGNALKFDGVDDYVEIPRSASLEPKILTICAWFKINKAPSVAGHIVDHYSSEGGYFLRVRNYGDRMVLQGYVRCGGTASGSDSRTLLETGKWYFGTFVADGEKIKLYLNGKLDVEASQTVLPCGIDKPIRIGAYTPTTWLFNGIIDEVRIYSRALSEEEIKELYQQGLTKLIPVNSHPQLIERGKILHFTFDGTDPSKVYDISGYKNDGIIGGAIRDVGFIGKAMKFDGVDDYVEVPNTPVLDTVGQTNAFTVSVWVKPYVIWNYDRIVYWLGSLMHVYVVEGEGRMRCLVSGLDPGVYVSNSPLEADKWSFWALTWDGSKVRLYKNGELDTELSSTGTFDPSGRKVVIGNWENYTDPRTFHGWIDEVRIYNRALSSEEIRALYLNYMKKKKKVE